MRRSLFLLALAALLSGCEGTPTGDSPAAAGTRTVPLGRAEGGHGASAHPGPVGGKG